MARARNHLNQLAGKELKARDLEKYNSIRDEAYNVLTEEWAGTRDVSINPESGLIEIGNIIPSEENPRQKTINLLMALTNGEKDGGYYDNYPVGATPGKGALQEAIALGQVHSDSLKKVGTGGMRDSSSKAISTDEIADSVIDTTFKTGAGYNVNHGGPISLQYKDAGHNHAYNTNPELGSDYENISPQARSENRITQDFDNEVAQDNMHNAVIGLIKEDPNTEYYSDEFIVNNDWEGRDLIDNLDIDLGSLSAPVAKAVDLQEGYKAALITLKRLRDKGISEHAEEEIPIKLQELRSQYIQDLHSVIHEPLNGSTVEFLPPVIDFTNPLKNGNMDETVVITLAPGMKPPKPEQVETSVAALTDEKNGKGNGNGYNGNGNGKNGNHDPVVNGNGNGHHGKGKKFRSDWSKEVSDISASELAKSYIKVIGEAQSKKPKQALDGLSGSTLWDSGKEVAEVEPYWSKALQHVRNGGHWVFQDRVLGSVPSQAELNWYNSTRGNQ